MPIDDRTSWAWAGVNAGKRLRRSDQLGPSSH
jgi:hypothetical protein